MTNTAEAKKAPDNSGKRLARLAAVQGLYQIVLTGRTASQVIKDFIAHPPELLEEGDHSDSRLRMDRELFGTLVTGVMAHADDIDAMLAGAMDERFSIARLEILLRSILRAGAYELHHQSGTAAGIIINDYVEVTRGFFNEKEPGLVNAILDRLAKSLR